MRPKRLATEAGSVERLVPGGAGAVRIDAAVGGSHVWLVAGVAPGERVEVEPGKPARLLRVLTPSPDRVAPACQHVARCGGCDWMHLGEDAQRREHARIVHELVSHALGAGTPEPTAHASVRSIGYRARARLFVQGRGGEMRVGYRAAGSREIAAVSDCIVLGPALAPMLGDLAAVFAGARGEGDAAVALGAGGLPVVSLDFKGELPGAVWGRLDARVTRGAWAGARVELDGAARPAVFGDPRPILSGADGAPLVIPAGGFAQPSDDGFAALARRVAELAAPGSSAPPRVLELFAGSGALSILLAPRAQSFTAVEIDPAAAAACQGNLAARGLSGAVSTGDANAARIAAVDVVVLDPPRTGAAGAARAIAASRARDVVYVACDPPTLARDLAILAASGFTLTDLETFELFPQTSHVETVARLARSR